MILILTFFVTTPKYLIIGDSISAYDEGWQTLVCQRREASCMNLSSGGKTTEWMLNQLIEHFKKAPYETYDKIYIYGGINDAFSLIAFDADKQVARSVQNVQRMVDLSKMKCVNVVLIIGYDADVISDTWIKDKSLEKECVRRYKMYQDGISKISGVKIVKFNLEHRDTFDGIHPNKKAHVKMAKTIMEAD